MTRFGLTGLAGLIALALTSSSASAAAPTFERQAQSSFHQPVGKAGGFRIVNTTFTATEIPASDPKGVQQILLEQTCVLDQDWDVDGSPQDMTVTARVIADGKFDKPLWSFHEQADRGELWDDLYRTVYLGREGGEDLYRYHSLITGRVEFQTTTDPVLIHIVGRREPGPMIITYVSSRSEQEIGVLNRAPNALGLLVMQQRGHVFDRLVLVGADAMSGLSPKMTAVDRLGTAVDRLATGLSPVESQGLVLLRRGDMSEAETWSGFDLHLRYEKDLGAPVIVIPVKDGRFAIEAAVLPKGVSLRRDLTAAQ